MKIRSQIFTVLAAGCLMGLAWPPRAAAVSDDDFNKLKDMVQQLGEKVQALEETHQKDQEKIHGLQQQVAETKKTAASAERKAEAASQVQPVAAVPSGSKATHDFMVIGDAEVQFGQTSHPGQHATFAMADFAPIFLFRANDNVLFEAGFDVTLQNVEGGGSTTSVSLSFATLDYMYNDYLTLMLGDVLLPLGTYSERSAGWLNKFPDEPLARGVLPGSGVGIEARGSIPVGHSGQMLTYSVYGVNGPSSVDGTGNSITVDGKPNLDLGGNVGILSDGTQANLHGSPSFGGRIGWFYPWKPHYDLEVGVSGQTGKWDNAGNRLWSGIAVDASLHITSNFEVKGEYMDTKVETEDIGTYNPRGWWIQGGYKLAGLNLDVPFISNVELVGRYDTVNDGLGTETDRETAGFVYYITNTLWFEGDYEWQHSNDSTVPTRAYIFQLSYGF